jgi:hypothetical protein
MFVFVAIAKQCFNYEESQCNIFLGAFLSKEAAISQIENHKIAPPEQNSRGVQHDNGRAWDYFVYKTFLDDFMNTSEDKAVYKIYNYVRR